MSAGAAAGGAPSAGAASGADAGGSANVGAGASAGAGGAPAAGAASGGAADVGGASGGASAGGAPSVGSASDTGGAAGVGGGAAAAGGSPNIGAGAGAGGAPSAGAASVGGSADLGGGAAGAGAPSAGASVGGDAGGFANPKQGGTPDAGGFASAGGKQGAPDAGGFTDVGGGGKQGAPDASGFADAGSAKQGAPDASGFADVSSAKQGAPDGGGFTAGAGANVGDPAGAGKQFSQPSSGFDVQGQASSSTATPSAPSTNTGLRDVHDHSVDQTTASAMREPTNIASQTDLQGVAGGGAAEAGFNSSIGSEGSAAIHGGAAGTGQNHMGGATEVDSQASATVGTTAVFGGHAASTTVDGAQGAAISESGYRDPTGEAARADLLSNRAGGDVRAKADVVENDREQIRNTVHDPRAAASSRAETAAMGEATSRSGGAAPAAIADATVIKDDARNPELAAEQHGEVELDKAKFEAQGAVGISAGSDDVANKPRDSGDKK